MVDLHRNVFLCLLCGPNFSHLLIRSPRAAIAAAVTFAVATTAVLIVSRVYLSEFFNFAQQRVPNCIGFDNFEHSFYYWLFYFSPYTRIFEFLMGCLTAHAFILVRQRKVILFERRGANVALGAALTVLVLYGLLYVDMIKVGQVNSYTGHFRFLCAPLIGYVMFYVVRYDTQFTRFMALPTLVALGDTSYSIYLTKPGPYGYFPDRPRRWIGCRASTRSDGWCLRFCSRS
jgi:peptidoglycan/LPS O-acetylase OafA/YrhL